MLLADSMAFQRANVPLDSVLRVMAEAFRQVPGVARVDLRRDLVKADTVRDAVARRWIHALPPSLPVVLLVSPKPPGGANDVIARIVVYKLAEVLGVPVGTVRSRLFRARRLLQQSLFTHAVDAGIIRATGTTESGGTP
jgi:hypothetical protein